MTPRQSRSCAVSFRCTLPQHDTALRTIQLSLHFSDRLTGALMPSRVNRTSGGGPLAALPSRTTVSPLKTCLTRAWPSLGNMTGLVEVGRESGAEDMTEITAGGKQRDCRGRDQRQEREDTQLVEWRRAKRRNGLCGTTSRGKIRDLCGGGD
jgi:hypothetical protein